MPYVFSEMSGALLGDKIVVGGGLGLSDVSTLMLTYQPNIDTWDSIPPMPVGLHHANMGAIGGELYILGGCDHRQSRQGKAPWLGSKHSFVYNPLTNKWRSLVKPIPHSTAAAGVVSFENKLYVIGGTDTNGVVLGLVQEYDPVNNTWRERAPMPTKREHLGIAVLDSLIYVAVGRESGNSNKSIKTFEAYSPTSNTWYTLPDIPTARSGVSMVAANKKIYVLGGEWPGMFDLVEVYDPTTKQWSPTSSMQRARHGFAAVTYKDTIYALGRSRKPEAFFPTSITPVLPKVKFSNLLFKKEGLFYNNQIIFNSMRRINGKKYSVPSKP